jgi:hypothetical protein
MQITIENLLETQVTNVGTMGGRSEGILCNPLWEPRFQWIFSGNIVGNVVKDIWGNIIGNVTSIAISDRHLVERLESKAETSLAMQRASDSREC